MTSNQHIKSSLSQHLECLNSVLDEYSKKYENYVFIGEFNVNSSDSSMKEFCNLNGLRNLINEPTCYKNSEKPTCIDLIITNQATLFQHSTVFEARLSDLLLDLLFIGTTKTMKMMSLDLKFKAFVF